MSRTTTMTVRLSGALSDFVAANVGENGSYENISEYVRDLIRRENVWDGDEHGCERGKTGDQNCPEIVNLTDRPAPGMACPPPTRSM